MMWGRFVAHQDLQTVLRCHIAAFEALGGVPAEILYHCMKTAVLGEVDDQGIAYNRKLLDLAAHYRFLPKACRPYRAKTTDEIEQLLFCFSKQLFVWRRAGVRFSPNPEHAPPPGRRQGLSLPMSWFRLQQPAASGGGDSTPR